MSIELLHSGVNALYGNALDELEVANAADNLVQLFRGLVEADLQQKGIGQYEFINKLTGATRRERREPPHEGGQK